MPIRNIVTWKGCLILLASGAACAATVGNVNNVDKQFMVTAARTDMTLAHEGRMAEDQAARADIKDFGKTLVQDHSTAYWQLSELAAKTGVTIPKGINIGHDRAIEQLVHLKGARFDRQFTTDEIAADRQLLAAFRREAKDGRDADVKAFASKMIPVLQKHLQLAEQFAKPVGRS